LSERAPILRPAVVRLEPNRPRRFYRGGARIEELRRLPRGDGFRPEDWIASTTTLYGRERDGLTLLPDGRFLRDAVAEDPAGWLGADHVAAFGGDTNLLVKLLDAGERLPVHCHPPRAFARRHLGCAHGKTEAWVVVAAEPDALVYVGFRNDADTATLTDWVVRQDRAALLEALNAIPVEPGDGILVPAGVPHAIGAGVLIVELQEPTDFSILLEHAGFDLGAGATTTLGLAEDTALSAVDRSAWNEQRLARILRRRDERAAVGATLLPAAADVFFRAERWRIDSDARLDPAYAALVVIAGSGELATAAGRWPLDRGDVMLVPHGAGSASLAGVLDVIRCRPPAPAPEAAT